MNPYNEVTSITWDPLYREAHKVLANGMAVSHTYDDGGRETLLAYYKVDGTPLSVYTATYDSVGNRLSVEELDGAEVTYGYDAADQLTSEERTGSNAYATDYTYDAAGNRLTKVEGSQTTTYEYDAANQLLVEAQPGGTRVTHTWDANGNQTSENPGGAVTTYEWDDENRLVSVTHPSRTVEQHAYRPDGLRRERSFPVNGIAEPVVLNEGEEDGQVGIAARKMNGTTSYYQVQVVLGSGADQPLSVSLDAGLFTITLGTDSSGNPDATKNTAALVAAALASHPEVSALASGDGSASLTAAEGPYSLGVLTHFLWDGVNVLEEADANLLPAAHYTDYPGQWGGLASMWRDEVKDLEQTLRRRLWSRLYFGSAGGEKSLPKHLAKRYRQWP